MSDCTVNDVLTDAMSLLGDPDGEITAELAADLGTAYSEVMSLLIKIAAPEITRELYYTLPADTNVLFPSQLGVTDFAEPQQIWERGNVTTAAITKVVDGSPIIVTTGTTVPSPTDGRVELSGIPNVPAYVNRDWFITATGNPGEFKLNGSITTGVGGTLATTGTVSWSSDRFTRMGVLDTQPPSNAPATSTLGAWRWENGAIYFPNGCDLARQLWIEYLADETPPPSGTIGLANGRELKFLSHATAAHFSAKRQLVMGAQLSAWAYGPSGEADGTGGLLRALIVPILKQKQGLPRQSGRYRLRRGVVIIT